jgi:predicted nucleic acid-binding protein
MEVTSRYVLDTNAVLYFLGGLVTGDLPGGDYYVSVITEIELLAYPSLTKDEEIRINIFLKDINVLGIESVVKRYAIELRKCHNLKLPDAIIAATALALNATLLTNDQKLLALTILPTQSILIKA